MKLYILIGAPGSGKSYFAKHHLIEGPGWRYISRDEVRFEIVKEDEEYFSHETKVFNEFVRRIKAAFNDDGVFNVIADATHLNWASRRKLINALGNMKCDIIPVVINNDITTIIEQNEQRTGRSCVPRSAVRRMFAQMTDPKTDPYSYVAIMYVDNRKEDKNDMDNQ